MLVYLDDILVFLKNEDEDVAHMSKIFKILCNYRLYAKLFKCHFAKNELHYFGHVVDKDGIRVDLAKIEIVMK